MTLNRDAKFQEKLTCGSQYDMTSLVNFHPTTQKSENVTSMGYFCPKDLKFELKKYRRVTFHGTEQWCKIWINSDLVVSNMAWWIGWTFIRAPESLKKCTLISSFSPKHIMFHSENFEVIMYYDTEGCCKS